MSKKCKICGLLAGKENLEIFPSYSGRYCRSCHNLKKNSKYEKKRIKLYYKTCKICSIYGVESLFIGLTCKKCISNKNYENYLIKNNKKRTKRKHNEFYTKNMCKICNFTGLKELFYGNRCKKCVAKLNYNNKKNNSMLKLRDLLSKSIRNNILKNNSKKNNSSCIFNLNYSISELKIHLESLFEPWMTWENHGKYIKLGWDDNDSSTWTWQIDHIVPHSTFKYTSMEDEDFKKCWALDNLRPYSAKQNLIDGGSKVRHKGLK